MIPLVVLQVFGLITLALTGQVEAQQSKALFDIIEPLPFESYRLGSNLTCIYRVYSNIRNYNNVDHTLSIALRNDSMSFPISDSADTSLPNSVIDQYSDPKIVNYSIPSNLLPGQYQVTFHETVIKETLAISILMTPALPSAIPSSVDNNNNAPKGQQDSLENVTQNFPDELKDAIQKALSKASSITVATTLSTYAILFATLLLLLHTFHIF